MRGNESPGRIVTKFCTGVGVHDVITSANFYDCRLWGFERGGGSNFGYLHWLASSPLQHYRTTVRVCDLVTLSLLEHNLVLGGRRHINYFCFVIRCSLPLRSPIESAGNLTKYDIADDLGWPLKFISRTINSFMACISKIQRMYYMKSITAVKCYMWIVSNYFCCHIWPEELLYDGECDLLAIAKFLVLYLYI